MTEKPKTLFKKYIEDMQVALPRHFAPDGIYFGREGALRLAREVGYALADFDPAEVNKEITGLYSCLLVRFTFGTQAGTPINANLFMLTMLEARHKVNLERSLAAQGRARSMQEFGA